MIGIADVHWYLIRSKPRQEGIAALNLQRLGVEIFFPRCKPLIRIQGKNRSTGEALFPGYLFVQVDMSREFRKVHYAQGVQGVVKFGSNPALVEEAIIQSIKTRITNDFVNVQPPSFFKSGQVVRIENGPFSGFEAVFDKELNGPQRVAVLLNTVQCQARLVVDRHCLAIPTSY